MERSHEAILTARLEDAMLNGCSYISWDELYHWYDVNRLAARTLRDLCNRWDEITHNTKLGQLMHIPNRGGMFICAKNKVKPLSED